MPSWWGKSSSKDVKKKSSRENFIDAIQRLINPSVAKGSTKHGSLKTKKEKFPARSARSTVGSRSPSPSTQVSRCQSFSDGVHSHSLPLPRLPTSDIAKSPSPILQKRGKPPLHLPLPSPHILNRQDVETDLGTASVSSNCSAESEGTPDSRLQSPAGNDYETIGGNIVDNILSAACKGQSATYSPRNVKEIKKPASNLFGNQTASTSPNRGLLGYQAYVQSPHYGAFASAPDSSMSSPARSPRRNVCPEHIPSSIFLGSRPYQDVTILGSGQCSSPGSGQTSGHNSMGGDMSGQLFWLHSRGSTECSPIPSPRMTSPGPSSRIHSGAVSPLHPCACGTAPESPKQRHRLPLPPISNSNAPHFPSSCASTLSPYPRSPGRQDNPTSPGTRWKKGKLIGRGTFGHVYVGFNSDSGETRAIKEVTLFSDDAKSKECTRQLAQEIALLSRLRHPNIVRYYGSDMLGDKLYIYLEYVSGGSIHKLLQDYGCLREKVIRSFTRQILSGLAYLHGKNTVHRDIKGANILVDTNGHIKLADFGMAKHITGQSCPLSFKGSPYWMAPEVIKNSNGCNLAVDIWSLGCTVLEMATSKPPWSQYEGIAAMFKIGNSKELPPIPDHLSDEGKDFVRQCLQRNPSNRPTAVQLLAHPFVRNATAVPRTTSSTTEVFDPASSANPSKGWAFTDVPGRTMQQLAVTKPTSSSSRQMGNLSCPVSPSPMSSPRAAASSGASTPRRVAAVPPAVRQ